jgi:hypothetical protein
MMAIPGEKIQHAMFLKALSRFDFKRYAKAFPENSIPGIKSTEKAKRRKLFS